MKFAETRNISQRNKIVPDQIAEGRKVRQIYGLFQTNFFKNKTAEKAPDIYVRRFYAKMSN
jgi:hypothetical protein